MKVIYRDRVIEYDRTFNCKEYSCRRYIQCRVRKIYEVRSNYVCGCDVIDIGKCEV